MLVPFTWKVTGWFMIGWSAEFLTECFAMALLRYLAVAHFGRGRGDWVTGEYPPHWRSLVDEVAEALRFARHQRQHLAGAHVAVVVGADQAPRCAVRADVALRDGDPPSTGPGGLVDLDTSQAAITFASSGFSQLP